MFELYEKVKYGQHIKVLALNNQLGPNEYFPMVDADMICWNTLKWYVFKAVGECGPALSFKTGNGFHLYFPHTMCASLAAIKEKTSWFNSIIEQEYHDKAVENGYYTLRISKYGDNNITFHRRIDGGTTTTVGNKLEQFIKKTIKIFGEAQI